MVNIPAMDFDERKPTLTISVSSVSYAVKATIPSKSKKYDTSRAVEEFYREHAASLRSGKQGLHEKIVLGIYSIYKARIVKIARKYRSLSSIFGEDDLQQEALIAILQALRKYKHSPDVQMKFSTYLEWSIRNIFQRAIGNRDKYVEIYGRDGTFEKTMNYGKFAEQKKELEDAGCTYTTKRRFCYLSEILKDEDLQPGLNEAGLSRYEYGTSAETPEEHGETKETEATEEPGEGEAHEEPHNQLEVTAGPEPHNGINLQMIDGLYRQWARDQVPSGVTESDPMVLRIYDLYREHGEELLAPFRSNGTSISADEVRRSILAAIVRGLAHHDNDAVPAIPFSVSLRVAMKRSVQILQKKKLSKEMGGVS